MKLLIYCLWSTWNSKCIVKSQSYVFPNVLHSFKFLCTDFVLISKKLSREKLRYKLKDMHMMHWQYYCHNRSKCFYLKRLKISDTREHNLMNISVIYRVHSTVPGTNAMVLRIRAKVHCVRCNNFSANILYDTVSTTQNKTYFDLWTHSECCQFHVGHLASQSRLSQAVKHCRYRNNYD